MAADNRGLVLVVEDEPSISDIQALYLVREGFDVEVVRSGEAALDAMSARRPIAVVLDVGLPGIDGTEVVRRLRAAGDDVPVLMVTARDEEVDRLLGLEIGADDYITKPFSPREMVARVRAVLRRGRLGPAASVLESGSLRMDLDDHRVTVEGREIDLSPTEYELLAHLLRHPGRVFSRDELLTQVWGYSAAVPSRTVDVHVAQVRAKIGDAVRIRTVRGVGYGLDR
jgi:two-component system, OmpR family, response regulator MtrA